MDYLVKLGLRPKSSVMTATQTKRKTYKYKVHSAIYSWSQPMSQLRATHEVTKVAQDILSDPGNDGVITVNNEAFIDPAPECRKSFALIVSIVCEDGNEVTRFCTCPDGTELHVRDAGVICYF